MAAVTDARETLTNFVSAFEAAMQAAPAEPGWMQSIRRGAIERFASLGLPTARHEEWRKTSVAPIARTLFRLPEPGEGVARAGAGMLAELSFDSSTCHTIVFVNGRHVPALSATSELPEGVRLGSLATALHNTAASGSRGRGADVEELFCITDFNDDAFRALNTAFMQDGALLRIPEGVSIDEPIHVLFATLPDPDRPVPLMTHPRNLIVAGAGSRVTIVESYVGDMTISCLTNAVTEIAVGRNASVEHHKLQREAEAAFHVGTTHARVSRDGRFASHSIALGGALVRNDAIVTLSEEGAEGILNGLYMASGVQHIDNHTILDHVRPRCVSRELYKGVLEGQGRAVFNGRVIVRPDASGTDSRQVNRNLVLSEGALVDTKPELQIHNNDVKCTHAATIGQLDEDQMFYLRSRGLDVAASRDLLIHAFVRDIIGRLTVAALRDGLETAMLTRLPGYASVKEAAL